MVWIIISAVLFILVTAMFVYEAKNAPVAQLH